MPGSQCPGKAVLGSSGAEGQGKKGKGCCFPQHFALDEVASESLRQRLRIPPLTSIGERRIANGKSKAAVQPADGHGACVIDGAVDEVVELPAHPQSRQAQQDTEGCQQEGQPGMCEETFVHGRLRALSLEDAAVDVDRGTRDVGAHG